MRSRVRLLALGVAASAVYATKVAAVRRRQCPCRKGQVGIRLACHEIAQGFSYTPVHHVCCDNPSVRRGTLRPYGGRHSLGMVECEGRGVLVQGAMRLAVVHFSEKLVWSIALCLYMFQKLILQHLMWGRWHD